MTAHPAQPDEAAGAEKHAADAPPATLGAHNLGICARCGRYHYFPDWVTTVITAADRLSAQLAEIGDLAAPAHLCGCDNDPLECNHEAAVGELQERVDRLTAERDRLRTELESLKAHHATTRQMWQEAESHGEQLERERDRAFRERDSLVRRIAARIEECDIAQAERDEARAALKRVRALTIHPDGRPHMRQVTTRDVRAALATPAQPAADETLEEDG